MKTFSIISRTGLDTTQVALIALHKKMLMNTNDNNKTMCLLFDLKRAFNAIDIQSLLNYIVMVYEEIVIYGLYHFLWDVFR